MIKVVLTGSESTGKSELARRLGEHFRAPVSMEFVRSFAAKKGGRIELADHGPIARGQMAEEDEAMGQARDLVLLDTDLVSTVVYCEHYFGSCPAWIATEAGKRAGELYLLMRPDIPWQTDDVRDRGDRRDEMHELFRRKLEDMGLTYIDVGGTADERLATAVAAIERILNPIVDRRRA